jgi:hypothetical protein
MGRHGDLPEERHLLPLREVRLRVAAAVSRHAAAHGVRQPRVQGDNVEQAQADERSRQQARHSAMTEPSDSSSVEYGITSLGCSMFIPISASEFERIKAAREKAVFGLDMENRIELVMQNYAVFERELIEMALQLALRAFPDADEGSADYRTANRIVVNLLSTARLYIDQIDHELSAAYGKGSSLRPAVKDRLSAEYEARPGYRIMEALRNYVQHRGLPVYTVLYTGSRDDKSSPSKLRNTVTMVAKVETLERDSKFKRAVVPDLRAVADWQGHIQLTPLIREYIEALGRVHKELRRLVADDMRDSDSVLMAVRQRAEEFVANDTSVDEAVQPHRLAGLSITMRRADGDERYWIAVELTRRRQRLEQRNRFIDTLARRYISSIDTDA